MTSRYIYFLHKIGGSTPPRTPPPGVPLIYVLLRPHSATLLPQLPGASRTLLLLQRKVPKKPPGVSPLLLLLSRTKALQASSLFAAIARYWSASGLATAGITPAPVGPLSAELAKPGATQPFARMTTIATKPFWNFTKNYYEWVWVQFAVYGSGEADARVRGEAVRDAMDAVMSNPALLSMTPGQVAGCWREEGVSVSKLPDTNIPGGATYQGILKYRFQVNRTRP